MTTPAWLTRWQQRDDDELCYADQTLLLPNGLTLDEQWRVAQAMEEDAIAREQTRLRQEDPSDGA